MNRQPIMVISGVNLVEGGMLTIFREMVRAAVERVPKWTVYALVHRKGLLGIPGVIEMPFEHIKGSWLRRIRFEWLELGRLCDQLAPDVWISCHDISPRINAPKQFVYCHNAAPFSTQVGARQAWKDPTFALFKAFYGLLYGVNIKRNDGVIVQQAWMRQEFNRRYGVRNVIVAHPSGLPTTEESSARTRTAPKRFFYPTLPRVYKNIELIGAALQKLEKEYPDWRAEVVVTFDGSENDYAWQLATRFSHLKSLHLVGRQTPEEMNRRYKECDALLFPSLLESWGLPLTEAKARGIPIIAADLPYAHETVGNCDAVRFFDPKNADALAELLLALSNGREAFKSVRRAPPAMPYANGWAELLEMLLGNVDAGRSKLERPAPTSHRTEPAN